MYIIHLVHLSYIISVIIMYITINPYFFLLKTNISMFLFFFGDENNEKTNITKKFLKKKRIKKKNEINYIFYIFKIWKVYICVS